MKFEFYTASKIVFERGGIKKLPALCGGFGQHCLIVTGGQSLRRSGVLDAIVAGLNAQGIGSTIHDGITGEPTPEIVDTAVRVGKDAGVDIVVGIGGGSVLDTAKAAAGVISNGGSVRDYLEGVGTGAKIVREPLPFIAIPTTSGTGTEVTKNAVIMSLDEGFKKSIRDEKLIPNVALLDPELTVSVPQSVTAASGMDAICQLIESYTSRNANAFCDAMALYHTPRAVKALKKACDDGSDMDARETMALAALVSGMCLANAGLGAAHGIGAGLGATMGIRHGIACGMLLPHVMRYNISRGVLKYADLAPALCGRAFNNAQAAALAAADVVAELCADLGLPSRLGELAVTEDMAAKLAAASMGSSMSKNPVEILQSDCEELIRTLI
jgi:alcohol dehydrogenase class IV